MKATRSPSPLRRRADSGRALLGAITDTARGLRLLMLGLVAVYACSGITRVGPEEDALVYRLGRLLPETHGPGLILALPAPVDRVVRVATRRQHELMLHAWSADEESAAAIAAQSAAAPPAIAPAPSAVPTPMLMALTAPPADATPVARGLHPVFDGYTLTGDVNLVQARFTARFRIVDPHAWVAAGEAATNTALIEASLFAAVAAELAGTRIDEALGTGLETLRRRVRERAQPRLDALRLGVELTAFETKALTPPLAAAGAFAAVTSAQVEARTALEQVRAYRARTLPRSQGEAYALREGADAAARQSVARASGEAASFRALLTEYRAAPELVRTRLRTETLELVLSRARHRTVLPDAGAINLLLRDAK